jgi:hypothetical protein
MMKAVVFERYDHLFLNAQMRLAHLQGEFLAAAAVAQRLKA